MAIFGREEEPQSTPAARPEPQRPSEQPRTAGRATLISNGTLIKGEIGGATDIQIEGRVEGTLDVDSLVTVGSAGRVSGEIHAKSVTVAGKVVGNIHGADRIDIQSSAKLEGDVKAPRVSIADGAYFKGRVEMVTESASQATKPVSKPPNKPMTQSATRPASQPSLDAVKTGESAK